MDNSNDSTPLGVPSRANLQSAILPISICFFSHVLLENSLYRVGWCSQFKNEFNINPASRAEC